MLHDDHALLVKVTSHEVPRRDRHPNHNLVTSVTSPLRRDFERLKIRVEIPLIFLNDGIHA
jgi:hypothetical protein